MEGVFRIQCQFIVSGLIEIEFAALRRRTREYQILGILERKRIPHLKASGAG
jgi:hypothetical protein